MKVGTDIIEIIRIKEAIENGGKAFLDRVYTEKEQQYCESKKNVKYQHYAGRFAAKEAIFKTISNEMKTISWKDIEIVNESNGNPQVYLYNKKSDIQVSISHCKEYATATAILG